MSIKPPVPNSKSETLEQPTFSQKRGLLFPLPIYADLREADTRRSEKYLKTRVIVSETRVSECLRKHAGCVWGGGGGGGGGGLCKLRMRGVTRKRESLERPIYNRLNAELTFPRAYSKLEVRCRKNEIREWKSRRSFFCNARILFIEESLIVITRGNFWYFFLFFFFLIRELFSIDILY